MNTAPVRTGRYTHDELSLRTGVPCAALRDLPGPLPRGQCEQYAAIDVVRLAVVDRLMRSGVPVARAAALVRAAESRAITGFEPVRASQIPAPGSKLGLQ